MPLKQFNGQRLWQINLLIGTSIKKGFVIIKGTGYYCEMINRLPMHARSNILYLNVFDDTEIQQGSLKCSERKSVSLVCS
jgi:hypothetical protein